MTRLRVVVKDPEKVDKGLLTKVNGVLRVVGTDKEPQIVLGPGVAEDVCTELKNLPGLNYTEMASSGAVMEKKMPEVFSVFLLKFLLH